MPNLCNLHIKWLIRMGWVGLLILLMLGCRIDKQQQPQTAMDDGPLFPSLKPNQDFFKMFKPSNEREWVAGMEVLPSTDINGKVVPIHNIRPSRRPAGRVFETS